jgi:hypothetical protein
MDFLLAGTLSSFIDGVSMPGDCPASLHLLLFVCGKQSAPRRTPFRQATKLFAFPPESAFTFRPECCSESQRNRVQLQSGIAFTFDRIPQSSQCFKQKERLPRVRR